MLLTGIPDIDLSIKKELASSTTLESTHQVIAEWNYNAYTDIKEIGCYYADNNNELQIDQDAGAHTYYYSLDVDESISEKDIEREKYTPLKSIFETNRPDPGIVHGVYSKYAKKQYLNGDSKNHSLSLSRLFNMSKDHARFYPLSKNSTYKYWISSRKTKNETVGISSHKQNSNGHYSINYSSPFIEYSSEMSINKIVIKTQKHLGYPIEWRIDVLKGNKWQNIYASNTNNTTKYLLKDGVLELYYGDSSSDTGWTIFNRTIESSNEKTVTDFSLDSKGCDKISGIRFIVNAMSAPGIPLEVIEISPRLVADITNNVQSFNVRSSMSNSVYGLPIGSVISSTGSLTLSNYEGYFSKNNNQTILQNILKPNVEIRLYQKLTIDGKLYRFPLKTMYTGLWDETSDFAVTTQLEDYFKFFKEKTSPDLMIANQSGVPTSVAMLVFLDNVGFNNFRFEKTSNDSNGDKEDVVLDFFYTKKEQTIMEVIESLAVSTQTAIYMDVDNELVAMTKEKMIKKQDIKDFWMVGNKEITTGAPITRKTYYDGESFPYIPYLPNIISFDEALEPPITDVNVNYTGIGIEKKSMALVANSGDIKNVNDVLERPDFGASIVNKDLKYTSDIVWQAGNDKQLADNFLCAAALVEDLDSIRPKDKLSKYNVYANNENDAIRSYYFDKDGKKYMDIKLDQNQINTFSQSGQYSGYVLINSELIRYNGIGYIFDDSKNKVYKKLIFFNKEEYSAAKSKLSQGGSLYAVSLIVDLELEDLGKVNKGNDKAFKVFSDGRGANQTTVVKHKAINTKKDFLSTHTDWRKKGVNLYSNSIPSTITNGLTVTDRVETYLANKTMKFNTLIQSFPGSVKLSGPKGGNSLKRILSTTESAKKGLPISTASEQVVTGIFRNITYNGKNVPINKIATRMRLVGEVPKNVNAGAKTITNGNIGGIAWNVEFQKNGMTGYFLELEDVGTIDGASLKTANYRNVRLYRVSLVNKTYSVKLLGNAWVNISATPNIGQDIQEQLQTAQGNGKIYAQIFDVEVVILRLKNSTRQYDVYWEDQIVGSFQEKSGFLKQTSKIGLFVRGESTAIFEYLSASSSPFDVQPKKSEMFANIKQKSFTKNLGKKGFLPSGICLRKDVLGKKDILFFEDFGRYVRQVRRYDIRYTLPTLSPRLISLAALNDNYYIADFTPTNYGASFWLYNTSNGSIQIDEASKTPLYISGFALKDIASGTLQSSKILEKEDFDRDLNDQYNQNRKLYGKQELTISGEYINNYNQALSLLNWTIKNLSKERKTITLSIFPNPILKLGDKVGLVYDDKYYKDDIADVSYTITMIDHSISNAGPDMTIELKECV